MDHPYTRTNAGGTGAAPAARWGRAGDVLLTVGHGPDDRAVLAARLTDAGIDLLVDVRRFPGSRSNPDVRLEELERWAAAGAPLSDQAASNSSR